MTFALNYAPTVGTRLTVVNNTGAAAIQGAFSNLAQGQLVRMIYGGTAYSFVANYYGGTDNDLVLEWANTRLLAWGGNGSGRLGINSTTNSNVPVAVIMSGVLSGKTILANIPGGAHSLAMCSGTLAAWGQGGNGQLGNNNTTDSSVPVAVNRTGALAGKTVVAMGGGSVDSLALCSDGKIAAWGSYSSGQLGYDSVSPPYLTNSVPFPVDQSGVLAGKRVIAVAAGASHSLALCSDGMLAAWGDNYVAQLGNNAHLTTNDLSRVPILVNDFGALVGRQVKAITAGSNHNLALCADGALVAWGSNSNGQYGNNTTTSSKVPGSGQ